MIFIIYLDHASTSPLSESVQTYLLSLLDEYGNPSSIHSMGAKARNIIRQSRNLTAEFINADAENIYFTGSGSASNTLGIKGYYSKHNCCILYSPIAHKSVLKCVLSYKYSYPLKVDNCGFIDIQDLKSWLDTRDGKAFIVMDLANSEIGTIQHVKEIIDLVHFYNGTVYLDCTGSISTIPLNVKELDVDMCGFSAHKLGGLKGCGVFYKKPDIELEPLIYGSQEQGLIGGTENVLGIAYLGKAVENYDYSSVSPQNRDYVYQYITANIPDSYLVGSMENRLAYNLYVCFKGIEGETLALLLDLKGILVSTGSACNSGSITASAALSAIKIDETDIHCCIRMTFSGKETREELDFVCAALKECVYELRNFND